MQSTQLIYFENALFTKNCRMLKIINMCV